MIEALRVIKNANGDIIILSDANTVYIEEILKAYEVNDLISNVISNPATWDEDGRLHIRRLNNIPHGCENPCSENICKGHELIKFLSAHPNEYDQIIYVGDSFNDFCPATKMSSIKIWTDESVRELFTGKMPTKYLNLLMIFSGIKINKLLFNYV
ncbi:16772_t:CDS:2 [Racocetra fulgida]|uniref:16772_t:CDS:1 n=1 Tax=Racocetra fulgida TaxID=60492 RepID=A0A9N9AMW9_9GLOM|nr:16772_t:CDS:2 [Racocetra fulgida]